MFSSTGENRQVFVAGTVWNIWASYWTGQNQLIPPLCFLRQGAGQDLLFVSGVGGKELDGFIAAAITQPHFRFVKQGDWWLPTRTWYGHWSVFSATVRQPYTETEHPVWG